MTPLRLLLQAARRDPVDPGHPPRVARLALRLGRCAGLDREQLRALACAALLHDVGKLLLPASLFTARRALTPPERLRVQQHPVIGARLAAAAGCDPVVVDAIRHHHEAWDGTGYPDQLAGEATPLLARILAIVDVYDALSSPRPYRPAWPPERVHRYLLGGAGTQFDPRLARLWYDCLLSAPLERPTPARIHSPLPLT